MSLLLVLLAQRNLIDFRITIWAVLILSMSRHALAVRLGNMMPLGTIYGWNSIDLQCGTIPSMHWGHAYTINFG